MKQLCHSIYLKVNIADRNLSEAGKHKSQFRVSSVLQSVSILMKLIFDCFLLSGSTAAPADKQLRIPSPTDPLEKKG